MKIFVITGTYPTKFNQQAGGFINDQVQALAEAGNEVVVLAGQGLGWRRWKEIEGSRIQKTVNKRITIYDIRYRGIAQSRLPRLGIYSFNKRLKILFNEAVMENGNPDVLYAHFTFPAGYGASIIAWSYKIPLVVMEHHSLLLKNRVNKYIKELLKKTVENSSEFICVSQALKNSIQSITNTEKNISVLPNIIDTQFTYKPREDKVDFVFFSAGNLVKGKAFDILIRAFIDAFSIDESVILFIAGDGPEKSNLMKMISRNKREHQIKLLGRLNKKEMLRNYEICDSFVLASRRETFGIVYREAMAVGRPVISTNNGGIEDGWKDYMGLITEIDDIYGLSSAMRKIKENINHYDGEKISNYILKNYSKEFILNQLEYKFDKVCSKQVR